MSDHLRMDGPVDSGRCATAVAADLVADVAWDFTHLADTWTQPGSRSHNALRWAATRMLDAANCFYNVAGLDINEEVAWLERDSSGI